MPKKRKIPKKIGFLGMGAMGGIMVKHLVSDGYDVTGFDPDKVAAAAARRAGVRIAGSAADAVREAEVVCSSLPTTEAVREVYLGGGGALKAMRKGTVCFEHSTFSAGVAREIGAAARKMGIAFLDVPIQGSIPYLEKRQSSAMAGGDRRALDKNSDVIKAYCKRVTHMGAPGNGLLMKLASNHTMFCMHAGLAEGLAFGKKAGLDPVEIVGFFKGTPMAELLDYKGDMMARRDYTPGAKMDLCIKDLLISTEEANRMGASVPLGTATCQQYVAAGALGHLKSDMNAVFEAYIQAMGERPKRGKRAAR